MLRFLLLASAMLVAARMDAADPAKSPPVIPFDINDWTPRPAVGKAEPWEKATDKDWVDARFRSMNTGPFLNCTLRYPHVGTASIAYKASIVKLGDKGQAGVAFDRNTLKLVAGWSGGYLKHGDRRFGLLNTPTPDGMLAFSLPEGPGWADAQGNSSTKQQQHTAPLPATWAKYRGHYVHGDRVIWKYTVGKTEVLDSVRLLNNQLVRSLQVGPHAEKLTLLLDRPLELPASNRATTVSLRDTTPSLNPRDQEDLTKLIQPGARRWGKPIVTRLVRGSESGPFAIDTLTIPYENPHKALFFCTGLDFLPDGQIAVCTCHGDVWLVRVDETNGECRWQRFATGLYHPLGLKVVDDKIIVLERGQLTRLHDSNDDGEADYYECVNNDWHTGAGEHSYDTCLETDPQGNFYFFKTGDTHLPHGGCLMKVSRDGSRCEVFATGFRHPIGLGMSPTGIITGADQEGNWMPATRIDQYKPGGFYGDMRANHRDVPPQSFDGPLCWVPREIDNSAGGQVWVPRDSNWPLAGLPVHLSYGRCKGFVLLRQELANGVVQGGVSDLGWRFLSGVCRGRFHSDGNLYVCGLNGWQTAAQADGCLQRVRYTQKPMDIPVRMQVVPEGIQLTFTRKLDRGAAENPSNYRVACWGYRWSGDYGSKRWKVSNPGVEGQDDRAISSVMLQSDRKTVLLKIPDMQPVMQMQVGYNIQADDSAKVMGSVYLTVHQVKP